MKKCVNGRAVELTQQEAAEQKERIKAHLAGEREDPSLEVRVRQMEEMFIGLCEMLEKLGVLKTRT